MPGRVALLNAGFELHQSACMVLHNHAKACCMSCCELVVAVQSCTQCDAGDTTIQLLWRIQNGELPATTDTKQAVVLIGTNDLTAYHQHQVQTCCCEHALSMLSCCLLSVCDLHGMHVPTDLCILYTVGLDCIWTCCTLT